MFSDDLYGMDRYSDNWTSQQNKLFEHALAIVPEDAPNRWQSIAGVIGVKSPAEVRRHYENLLHDLSEIEAGRIDLPNYSDDREQSASGSRSRSGDGEKKKGVPWTEEEHRLFLIGLQKYGKGDWRSISRNAVISRTPTQVASHAQKYYLRLNSVKKEKKRSSIHDITTVDDATQSPPQMKNNAGPSLSFDHQTIMPGSFYQPLASIGFQHFGYKF